MKKVLVVALAVLGICNAVADNSKEIKLENGGTIKVVEPQKKGGFPSPRTYTKYIGKIDGDSVFVTKTGKYCKIKVSPKTGREYAQWLKTE